MKNTLMQLLKRHRTCVGIYVADSEVRAAAVISAGGGPRLEWYRRLPFPAGSRTDPGERDQTLVSALASFAEEAAGCCVVTALPGAATIERLMRLPAMPEREMAAAVRWEAEQQIPVPIDGMLLRHAVVGRVEGGDNQVNVLMAAVPEERVRGWHALFARAGLSLTAVDLPVLALWRALFGWPGNAPPDALTAVADLEPTVVHMLIVDKGAILAIRSAAVNGVFDHGLPGRLEAAAAGEGPGGPADEARLEGPVGDPALFAPALSEVRRFLDYVQNVHRRRAVARLLLTGSGATVPGVADRLAGEAGVPVEAVSVLPAMYTIAAGLALWGVKG